MAGRKHWLFGVFILLLLLLAYWPALQAGYIWDDNLWLTQNPLLHNLKGLGRIWYDLDSVPEYYPLTLSTFWLEFQLWHLAPLGYHLDNLLLHATNALLLALLLKRLNVPGAYLAAALFALHPVNVESVAWVTERKNTLSGFFYILSLLVVIRTKPDIPNNHRRYLLSLIFFLCAVLAKTIAVTLPIVLLILIWWKNRRLTVRDVRLTIPYFIISLAAGVFAMWMQTHHTGATGRLFHYSFVERCLIAGHAFWFYLGKIVWPTHLSFIYPKWSIDAHQSRQCLLSLAALLLLLAAWFRRECWGRGPIVALLCFTATLLPALGFFNVYWQIYTFVADHMLYLAAIGPIALLSAGIARYAPPLGIILPVVFAVLVWQQSQQYKDSLMLWEATVQTNPNSWMVHTNLGHALVADGREPDAAIEYQHALQLGPDIPDNYHNVGLLLVHQDRLNDAADQFRKSIQIDPHYSTGYTDLSRIYEKQDQLKRANSILAEGLMQNPEDPTLWKSRGDELLKQDETDQAIAAYRNAIIFRPSYAEAHFDLGNLLLARQDLSGAAHEFQAAIDYQPDRPESYINLAAVRMMQGDAKAAAALREKAIRERD